MASRIFGGSLRSDVLCAACAAACTTVDHVTHLSLDIPAPAAILLRDNANALNSKAGAAAIKA